MSSPQPRYFLSPEAQDLFWANIVPDVRNFIKDFESRESWTFKHQELPSLFYEMSKQLALFNNFDIRKNSRSWVQAVIHDLVVILAALPVGSCISSISYLDRKIATGGELSWGALVYMECSSIMNRYPEHPNFQEFRVVHERLSVMFVSRIASQLFTQLNTLATE